MNSLASPSAPRAPVNAALSNSLELLFQCENTVRIIRAKIHGDTTEMAGASTGERPVIGASDLSNTLSGRLGQLVSALNEIEQSF